MELIPRLRLLKSILKTVVVMSICSTVAVVSAVEKDEVCKEVGSVDFDQGFWYRSATPTTATQADYHALRELIKNLVMQTIRLDVDGLRRQLSLEMIAQIDCVEKSSQKKLFSRYALKVSAEQPKKTLDAIVIKIDWGLQSISTNLYFSESATGACITTAQMLDTFDIRPRITTQGKYLRQPMSDSWTWDFQSKPFKNHVLVADFYARTKCLYKVYYYTYDNFFSIYDNPGK